MRTHTPQSSYTPVVSKDVLHELFFTQSLDGFFIMMLDEPIDWNDSADKEALLDYIFAHQHMTIANEAFARHYAMPLSQIIGMTPADFYRHDIARGREGWRAMLDAGAVHIETDERRGDGTPVRIEGHYLCIRDELGRVTGHIGIQRDITDRHAAAEEVARSREELRVLAAHLNTVREGERTRIARELHDELGQVLTSLKLDLAWLEHRLAKNQSSDLAERAREMVERMDGVMFSVRRIVTELRPSVLDELGLADAIEWQTQDFAARTGVTVALNVDHDGTNVPEPIASTVFRILQEALTNVTRHSGAKRVVVKLVNETGVLALRVRDDGRGIRREELHGKHSLGLLGLRERAVACGGTLDISGQPGHGTTVMLRIPLRSSVR
jgi:two-component system, NarL family, sensor histidine kinase UhpB